MHRFVVAAVAIFLAAPAALAATYTLALSEDGVGDAGADWFGTIVAPDISAGWAPVLSARVVFLGATYEPLPRPYYFDYFTPGSFGPRSFVDGWVAAGDPQAGVAVPGIYFDTFRVPGGPFFYTWETVVCRPLPRYCDVDPNQRRGTYTIIPVPPEVPLPASLPLLAGVLGLGALAARRGRSR